MPSTDPANLRPTTPEAAADPRRLRRPRARAALRAMAFASGLALVAAGCGDDSSSNEDESSSEQDSVDESTTEGEGTSDGPAPAEGTVVYELPGDEVYPEGVAYDADTDRFFVSATGDGALFVGDRADGTVETFVEGGTDGRSTAVGLAVDGERRRLWAAGGEDQTVSVYDLDDASLVAQMQADEVEGGFLNDVTVAADGTAYITDSGGSRGHILRVQEGDDGPGELEPWVELADTPMGAGAATNGIAVTPDDAEVIVVDLVGGSAVRIDRESEAASEVAPAGALAAPDGISVLDDRMYVVSGPGVSTVEFADDGTMAGSPTLQSDDAFAFATTSAVVGDRLIVVNSQFDQRQAGTPALPFTVVEIDQP